MISSESHEPAPHSWTMNLPHTPGQGGRLSWSPPVWTPRRGPEALPGRSRKPSRALSNPSRALEMKLQGLIACPGTGAVYLQFSGLWPSIAEGMYTLLLWLGPCIRCLCPKVPIQKALFEAKVYKKGVYGFYGHVVFGSHKQLLSEGSGS